MNKTKFISLTAGLVLAMAFTLSCSGDNDDGGSSSSVVGQAPTITTTTLAGGTVGTPYSQTLTATGDATITWTLDSGTLPTSLTISTAGVISGTPISLQQGWNYIYATFTAGGDYGGTFTYTASTTPPVGSNWTLYLYAN